MNALSVFRVFDASSSLLRSFLVQSGCENSKTLRQDIAFCLKSVALIKFEGFGSRFKRSETTRDVN